MAITQSELDELIQLGKKVARTFTPGPGHDIVVTTSSGERRATAWVFPNHDTGLTDYGNIIGRNGATWKHMKTVDEWNTFSDPDGTFRFVKDVLSAMRDSL